MLTWLSDWPRSYASTAVTPSQPEHPGCTPHAAAGHALPAQLPLELPQLQVRVVAVGQVVMCHQGSMHVQMGG